MASELCLRRQVGGDHLLHAFRRPSVPLQALGGSDPIELHAQLFWDPTGEQHLAVPAGGIALGRYRQSGQFSAMSTWWGLNRSSSHVSFCLPFPLAGQQLLSLASAGVQPRDRPHEGEWPRPSLAAAGAENNLQPPGMGAVQ